MEKTNRKLPMPFLYFQGGGYPGCFWEPNILVFDRTEDGLKPLSQKAQPLLSGYTGDDVMKAAETGILEATRVARKHEGHWVKNEEDWLWFCKHVGEGYVRRAAKGLLDYHKDMHGYQRDYFYYLPCDDCGSMISPYETYHWSYQGNGGIGINWIGLLCDECLRAKHYEYVTKEWKHIGEKQRQEAWEKAKKEMGDYCPDWETVRDSDELLIYAEYVYEPEYL